MIVTDLKGEIFRSTAGYRKSKGSQVFLFAPGSERTHRYNPLDFIRPDRGDRTTDIQNMAAILVPEVTESENSIWQATALAPRSGFAWARVAELEFSFGRFGPAAEALDRALELAPRNAQALCLRGFLLAARRAPAAAIPVFDQAIEVDPKLANAWLGRGLARWKLGRRDEALSDLTMAAALEPQRGLLRSYLGKAYADSTSPDRAAHELELARRAEA